jgi:pimeloyl-ACP methyl ester carboxylesterase
MAEQEHPATVVLVHGACAGSWCWDLTGKELEARGIPHVAVDLPTVGAGVDPMLDYHADAAHVRGILDGIDGPVVLCGNSYGGVVITEASAGSSNVARLVYLAAFMLEADDEIPGSLLAEACPEFLAGLAFGDDGLATFNQELAKEVVFQQAPREVAQWAVDQFRPMAMGGGASTTMSAVGWHNIPSTFVVCSEDRAIQPDSQRRWAAERATESVELPYDHCPHISHPAEVAELLAKLATLATQ